MTKRSNPDDRAGASALEASELRAKALFLLAALERAEPSEMWASIRSITEDAKRLAELRTIYREIRSLLGGLRPLVRQQLDRDLEQRFGPDAAVLRDRQVVAAVQARGAINSEQEYRIVQAHLDSGVSDDSDGIALGALLDEFMAAPHRRTDK